MPIRREIFNNEEYYHTYNRSFNKKIIFSRERDKIRFIQLIKFCQLKVGCKYSYWSRQTSKRQLEIIESVKENSGFIVKVIAYCVMPNHFHLLLQQLTDNGIIQMMTKLTNAYAHFFNLKYRGIGPVFEGRFKTVAVNSNEQLLHLSRYIHLNPYSAGMIAKKEIVNYLFSSLGEFINEGGGEVVFPEIILNQFKNKQKYLDFVLDNADYQRELQIIKQQLIDIER
ncbi:MAG: transposase [Patescibacteria group bacterium]